MPGILAILAEVATNPEVDASVEKLITGLFSHVADLQAAGDHVGASQAVQDVLANTSQIVSAVTQNTPAATS